ncbi:MAG: hypothetical protein ACHQDD_04765 [Steroidobacterales bacterium]
MNPTLAQRRVQLAVKAALGSDYQVDWLGPGGGRGPHVLLLQHAGTRRAAALLFDDIQTCARALLMDYAGAIPVADKRVAEVVVVGVTQPEQARAMIQGPEEPGGATALHHALDAALAALLMEDPDAG